MRGFLT